MRFSGFGTLGVAHVDAPADWVYRRDISQPQNSSSTRFDLDTRWGLQLNHAPSTCFELVGQALLTRRAPASVDAAVEWAFGAYRPNADGMLRLGRVSQDAFQMSDHRHVGFAYPDARPLPEVAAPAGALLSRFTIDDVKHRYASIGARYDSGDGTLGVPGGQRLTSATEGLVARRRLGPRGPGGAEGAMGPCSRQRQRKYAVGPSHAASCRRQCGQRRGCRPPRAAE